LKYVTEGSSVANAARAVRLVIIYKLVCQLRANPLNPRKHSTKQIAQLAKSVCTFGFLIPVLTDAEHTIIAGHARVEAAKLLGMTEVPTICVTDLTEAQIRAFMIADNRLTENAEWDPRLYAENLKYLFVELDVNIDPGALGLEKPEIDLSIQGLTPAFEGDDPADKIPETDDCALVTRPGHLWSLGAHCVFCGDAREPQAFDQLMAGRFAAMVVTDPPYNVPIDGHASGKGIVKHPDFVMASGELSRPEFIEFLIRVFILLAKYLVDGALAFIFMDWRHIGEVLAAGEAAFSQLKNLCVWTKDRAGMGSLYRSQHELVFLFKSGTAAHINNIQLGQFGRYRTNVWNYPSAVSFGHSGEEGNLLALHPTVKPVALVADAILDCSERGDIILDSFLGSGTTVIAAERTGRVCYGLELDPKYVDVTVRRWQAFTGKTAVHVPSGRTFCQLEEEADGGR